MNVRDLRGRHWGEAVWVVCNGPTLEKVDLRALKKQTTFGFNAVFLKGFVPTYLLVEDVLVAEDRAAEINAFRGPTKIFPRDCARWLNGQGTRYVDFRRSGSHRDDWPGFSVDCDRLVYWGGTVTYMALQLAYYMGAHRVYLVGCDNDYVVPDSVKRDGDVLTSTEEDPNHFDPSYFGPGYRWHDPKPERMEVAYRRAKEVYEEAGRRIVNCTVGGKLEVFERADWGAVLKGRAQ